HASSGSRGRVPSVRGWRVGLFRSVLACFAGLVLDAGPRPEMTLRLLAQPCARLVVHVLEQRAGLGRELPGLAAHDRAAQPAPAIDRQRALELGQAPEAFALVEQGRDARAQRLLVGHLRCTRNQGEEEEPAHAEVYLTAATRSGSLPRGLRRAAMPWAAHRVALRATRSRGPYAVVRCCTDVGRRDFALAPAPGATSTRIVVRKQRGAT